MKIKKGDSVKILTGKDRGKTAKVLRAYPKVNLIVAEGINLKRKHVRPRSQGKKGEIVQIPAPFAVSVAMLICSNCAKPARIGMRFENGVKVRICKKCKAVII